MKTRLFLLFLIFATLATAQDAAFYPKLAVKLSPLSALDPLTSTLAGSITYRPAPWLGLHVEYGWQHKLLKSTGHTSRLLNSRYYELRPEIQFFADWSGTQEVYLALEGFYIPHTFSLEHSYINLNRRDIRFDSADGNRFTHGLALKGGVQFLISDYFLLEVFSGFGYRRREINIFNLVNPREDNVHNNHHLSVNPYTQPGVKHRIHLSFGVRIGGVLARKKLER